MIDCVLVVVAFHSRDDLTRLIDSVPAAVDGLTWSLVVVNNAEDEDLTDLADGQGVLVVDGGGNVGYAGGINRGVARAPAHRVTVYLNPDLVLERQSIRRMVEAIDQGERAIVPRILDGQGSRPNSLRREPTIGRAMGDALFGDRWPGRPGALSETVREERAYTTRHSVDWATGAALAVLHADAQGVGEWDEGRFFMYSEETDFARRLRDAGLRITYLPDAVVHHRGSGSGHSAQLEALQEVNKLRYFQKWHSRPASTVFGAVLVLRNLVRPHRAGARVALRSLVSSRSRARLPGGVP